MVKAEKKKKRGRNANQEGYLHAPKNALPPPHPCNRPDYSVASLMPALFRSGPSTQDKAKQETKVPHVPYSILVKVPFCPRTKEMIMCPTTLISPVIHVEHFIEVDEVMAFGGEDDAMS